MASCLLWIKTSAGKVLISSAAASFQRCSCAAILKRDFSSYSQASGNEPDELYKTVEIEVKGHDPAVLNSYEMFVRMAAKGLDVNLSQVTSPPKVIKRYTLLKSVHIYRKHMVQYEMRTHFRCFEFKRLTGSTANTFLEYIQRNLPEGMAMKVTRHAVEALPSHLKPPLTAKQAEQTEIAEKSRIDN